MRKARRYRGVRQRHWGSWVSEIRHPVSKIRVWLGTFSSAEEAATAYDEAARILCGPKARTNFPTPLSSSPPSSASTSFSSTVSSSPGQVNHSSALSPSLREKLTRLTVDSSSEGSPQSSLQDILGFAASIGRSQNESEGRNRNSYDNAASMLVLLPQHGPNSCVGLSERVNENHREMFHIAPYVGVGNDVINAATTSTAAFPANMQLISSKAIHKDMSKGMTTLNKDTVDSILAAAARCCALLANAGEGSSDPFAAVSICSRVNTDSAMLAHQHFGPHQCLGEDMLSEYSWKLNMHARDALSLTKEAMLTSSNVALPQNHVPADVPPSIMQMNKNLQQAMPAAAPPTNSLLYSSSSEQDMLTELVNDFFQSNACSSFSLDTLPELPFSLNLLRE